MNCQPSSLGERRLTARARNTMRESLPPDHREDEPENGQRIAPLAGAALSITDTGLRWSCERRRRRGQL
jgi:hypothetical protein